MRKPKTQFEGVPKYLAHRYVREIIAARGGIRPLATELGVSFTTVWRWAHMKALPTQTMMPRVYRLYEAMRYNTVSAAAPERAS